MIFSLPVSAQGLTPPAQLNLIGYSENGRYLAYEEFGLSGEPLVPFAKFYVLDLRERRWVIGTPIASAGREREDSISEMRRQVWDSASFLIADLKINRPAFMAASIGDGALENDGQSLEFGIPQPDGSAPVVPFRLEISQYPAQAAAPCETFMDDAPTGFSLEISSYGRTSPIYEDGPLARSRGCPSAYRITGVAVPFEAADMSHAVAIVAAENLDRNGPYRSFVPVPLGTPGRGIN